MKNPLALPSFALAECIWFNWFSLEQERLLAVKLRLKSKEAGFDQFFSFLPFSLHPEISVLNLVTFSAGVVFYWNIVTFGRYKGTINSMTLLPDSFTLFSHANTFYGMSFLHANIPCHDKGIKCLETKKQITTTLLRWKSLCARVKLCCQERKATRGIQWGDSSRWGLSDDVWLRGLMEATRCWTCPALTGPEDMVP